MPTFNSNVFGQFYSVVCCFVLFEESAVLFRAIMSRCAVAIVLLLTINPFQISLFLLTINPFQINLLLLTINPFQIDLFLLTLFK